MNAKTASSLLRCILLLLLCAFSIFAQSQTTGRLTGSVRDQNGASIGGAEINVRSNASGAERKVVADDEGNYAVSVLHSGEYRVSVGARGFALSVFNPVPIVITETTRVDAVLVPLGPDAIEIRIDKLVQQDGPQLGRVVDSRAVSELPLATRNFTQILALSPGTSVSLPDNTALGRNSQNVSVNGARVTQNDFEI